MGWNDEANRSYLLHDRLYGANVETGSGWQSMKTKQCPRCQKTKSINQFYGANRYYCVECERQDARWRMMRPVNRIKTAYRDACREAKRFGVRNDLTFDDVAYVFKLANKRCTYCGKLHDRLSLEHIQPMCRGGANTVSNITAVCLSCNKKKGKQDPVDWLNVRGKFGIEQDLVAIVAARRGEPLKDVREEFMDGYAAYNDERIKRLLPEWVAQYKGAVG